MEGGKENFTATCASANGAIVNSVTVQGLYYEYDLLLRVKLPGGANRGATASSTSAPRTLASKQDPRAKRVQSLAATVRTLGRKTPSLRSMGLAPADEALRIGKSAKALSLNVALRWMPAEEGF